MGGFVGIGGCDGCSGITGIGGFLGTGGCELGLSVPGIGIDGRVGTGGRTGCSSGTGGLLAIGGRGISCSSIYCRAIISYRLPAVKYCAKEPTFGCHYIGSVSFAKGRFCRTASQALRNLDP